MSEDKENPVSDVSPEKLEAEGRCPSCGRLEAFHFGMCHCRQAQTHPVKVV